MKRFKYMMLYAGLLAITACSPEKIAPADETEQSAEVRLAAGISGSENGSRANTPDYIKTAFTTGDEIRLVNTLFFNTPDFDDENTIFTWTGETANNKYKFEQSVQNNTADESDEPKLITWNDFSPTSYVYMFEAVYYPGNTILTEVSTDQNDKNGEGFKEADLLLAHHRMLLEEAYDDINLTFHHAFAMVKVEVIVPIGVGGLSEDAFTAAHLKGVQTEYEVDYSSTISNDGLRKVTGKGKKRDVKMWLQSSTKNTTEHTQTYVFLALIPVPNFDTGETINENDFVHFTVKVDNKTEKTYRFVRTGTDAISLNQSQITVLKLKWDTEQGLPLLLTAEITPWTEASANMTLDQED